MPYGYDADPATKQLTPNPIEAPRAAAIFERASRGELPNQIANDINDLGWLTKVYHSKRSGKTTGKPPDAITPADVLAYVEYLRRERDNGDSAVNRQVTVLKNFYRAMVAMEQLDARENPLARFPRMKAQTGLPASVAGFAPPHAPEALCGTRTSSRFSRAAAAGLKKCLTGSMAVHFSIYAVREPTIPGRVRC